MFLACVWMSALFEKSNHHLWVPSLWILFLIMSWWNGAVAVKGSMSPHWPADACSSPGNRSFSVSPPGTPPSRQRSTSQPWPAGLPAHPWPGGSLGRGKCCAGHDQMFRCALKIRNHPNINSPTALPLAWLFISDVNFVYQHNNVHIYIFKTKGWVPVWV